jgi:hypothetical protein
MGRRCCAFVPHRPTKTRTCSVYSPASGADGTNRTGRAHYYRAEEGCRRLSATNREVQPRGIGSEVQHYRLRVEAHALCVGETSGICSRQAELQVGRVLVVGRDERTAHRAGEVLYRVLVAVVGQVAVVQYQRPGELRSRQSAILLVRGGAGERDSVPNPPSGGRRRRVYGRGGRVLPALIVSGESKVSVAPLLSVTLRSTR